MSDRPQQEIGKFTMSQKLKDSFSVLLAGDKQVDGEIILEAKVAEYLQFLESGINQTMESIKDIDALQKANEEGDFISFFDTVRKFSPNPNFTLIEFINSYFIFQNTNPKPSFILSNPFSDFFYRKLYSFIRSPDAADIAMNLIAGFEKAIEESIHRDKWSQLEGLGEEACKSGNIHTYLREVFKKVDQDKKQIYRDFVGLMLVGYMRVSDTDSFFSNEEKKPGPSYSSTSSSFNTIKNISDHLPKDIKMEQRGTLSKNKILNKLIESADLEEFESAISKSDSLEWPVDLIILGNNIKSAEDALSYLNRVNAEIDDVRVCEATFNILLKLREGADALEEKSGPSNSLEKLTIGTGSENSTLNSTFESIPQTNSLSSSNFSNSFTSPASSSLNSSSTADLTHGISFPEEVEMKRKVSQISTSPSSFVKPFNYSSIPIPANQFRFPVDFKAFLTKSHPTTTEVVAMVKKLEKEIGECELETQELLTSLVPPLVTTSGYIENINKAICFLEIVQGAFQGQYLIQAAEDIGTNFLTPLQKMRNNKPDNKYDDSVLLPNLAGFRKDVKDQKKLPASNSSSSASSAPGSTGSTALSITASSSNSSSFSSSSNFFSNSSASDHTSDSISSPVEQAGIKLPTLSNTSEESSSK